jgi:hopanoid biosynthesis associated protein HpnK
VVAVLDVNQTPLMPARHKQRRLIVNADDFGLSSDVNSAVIRGHREGILTTASLMVNEEGCPEAVELARENPQLGVGLHLSLAHGRSNLPAEQVPGLVDSTGRFRESGVAAGFSYFFNRRLRAQLEQEIEAQFKAFARTGLEMDHVNGHLNIHLHPVVLRIILDRVKACGIRAVRLTRDPFFLNAQLRKGAWGYRGSHALIYTLLSSWARPRLKRLNLNSTQHVFGLLQNGAVDEGYVLDLLRVLPPGDSELYSHPNTQQFKHELTALLSVPVRELIASEGVELIRYQDL